MFKNYFKTAWRSLINDKLHSFINIAGLSVGMTVAILIGLWMQDELSFDKSFKNHDRIARVVQNVTNNGEVQTWWAVPYPLASELRTQYGSDFKHIVMSVNWGNHLVSVGDKKFTERGGYFEKEMPEMFSLNMLRGKLNSLYDPSSVLLSASAATAYFGKEDPVNRIIRIDHQAPLKVAGVYEDFPQNSTLVNLNFIASWDFWYKAMGELKDMEDPWRPNFATLFAELNDHADLDKVSARIRDVKLKKVNAQLQKKKPALFLLPMDRWHLYSEFKNGVNTGGAIRYVHMFSIIGVFVLLLACINFMNLSTAKSEKRAREVGIRKTIGSLRRQLILQFLSESFLTVTLAFFFAILLAQFTLPFFNYVSNKKMFIMWGSPVFWLSGFAFVFFTALVAGSYPAFYLSSFRPVKVLKGTFKAGRFAALPRRILVVIQFTVSVALIIGTLVIYRQIQFAKDRPIGYSRSNLITIATGDSSIHSHFEAVKEELLHSGSVTSMAESESPTTGIWNSTSGFSWPGKDPNLSTDFGVVSASVDFGKTIGWEIKEGRGFSKDFLTDSSAVVLNEAAVHYMNLMHPVGETVTWWGKPLKVIGIIRNMVIESPYDEARPTIFTSLPYVGNIIILKLNPAVPATVALQKIEPIFKKFNPEQPFEYKFADEEYAKKFGDEERIGRLAGFFASLAVVISCLGLFGLTSFVAEQRKKEIGVRKVLGATVFNVWNLLSRDFVMLVIISFVVAVPLSWYFMQSWLQNYHYRVDLSWWIFALAGAGALFVTFVTVSFQAIKAAVANPVKSLRTE
jgi:putative ABC transport system permease protein